MVLYSDLLKRLQKMSFVQLSRPVILNTKGGLVVAKSLCEAQDYEDETSLVLPSDHLLIDAVHDNCESTDIDCLKERF